MKAFLITESFLRDIVRGATADEKVKHILQAGVIDKTSCLAEFVFNLFSYYMNAYGSVELDGYPLQEGEHVKDLFSPLTNFYDDSTDTSIRIVDPLDALYNRTFPKTDTAFSSHLFDDVFANIEDSFGTQEAHNWFDEVLQLLEYIVVTLESSFIDVRNRDDYTNFKVFFAHSGNSITVYVH